MTNSQQGTLRLVDDEKVELSNLNRQILHWEQDLGKYKVDSAKEKLASLNRDVSIETSRETISEDNVASLVEGCDVIVDGMDNLETRFVKVFSGTFFPLSTVVHCLVFQ